MLNTLKAAYEHWKLRRQLAHMLVVAVVVGVVGGVLMEIVPSHSNSDERSSIIDRHDVDAQALRAAVVAFLEPIRQSRINMPFR